MFVWSLVSEASDYRSGIRAVTAGEYETACEIFTELDGYRDSEVLREYCKIMAEYDAYDYPSVFRTYNDLNDIKIDNDKLEVEVACSRAEIKALYYHCGE